MVKPPDSNRPTHATSTSTRALSHRSRRTAPRRRSAAWQTTAGHAPATRAHRCPCAGPCDDPVETRHTHLASAPLRAKVPFLLERGLRPARLPGGALLDPARSRAPADRSAEQPFDRLRDEECRCAHRQAGQPALSAQRQGSRWSLSPAAAAHAARGTPRTALRVTQSPAPRRAAAQTQSLNRSPSERNPIRRVQAAGSTAGASPPPLRTPTDVREVAPARTWLLQTGWRRHGLIDPAEVP